MIRDLVRRGKERSRTSTAPDCTCPTAVGHRDDDLSRRRRSGARPARRARSISFRSPWICSERSRRSATPSQRPEAKRAEREVVRGVRLRDRRVAAQGGDRLLEDGQRARDVTRLEKREAAVVERPAALARGPGRLGHGRRLLATGDGLRDDDRLALVRHRPLDRLAVRRHRALDGLALQRLGEHHGRRLGAVADARERPGGPPPAATRTAAPDAGARRADAGARDGRSRVGASSGTGAAATVVPARVPKRVTQLEDELGAASPGARQGSSRDHGGERRRPRAGAPVRPPRPKGGGSLAWAIASAVTVSRSNGLRPVRSSKATQASA